MLHERRNLEDMAKIIKEVKGSFSGTLDFLKKVSSFNQIKIKKILEYYGEEGKTILAMNTPKDTGKTAASWEYEYSLKKDGCEITWYNTNLQNGVPIIVFIRYGHVTKNGHTWVQPNDFVTPIIEPIIRKIEEDIWNEVMN